MSVTHSNRFRLLPPDPNIGWTPYAWLIYFPSMFIWPAVEHASVAVWVASIAGGAIFLPLYFRSFWVKVRTEKLWIIGAIAAIGALLSPVNAGAPVMTIYATSSAGYLRPPKRAAFVIVAIVGAALLEAFAFQLPFSTWSWQVVFGLLVGFTNTHFAGVREANLKLVRAQEEISQLAKVAERERIARDMHDLLGHTLSLITLKSSLASRLADRDPARAIAEIRDVERISREALTEVRAAVAGYREFGLVSQVASATSMLEAAGIALQTDIATLAMSPEEETVLSLILRESVTNVVRHSNATRCTITLSDSYGLRTMCIADDGRGKSVPDGNGITGMRERIASLGGTLSVESFPGTRVRVTLPPASDVAVEPQSRARLTITA